MDGWRLESQAFRCAGRLRSLHQPLAARGRTDAGTGMTASTAQPNHSLISARSINTINSHAFSMAAPRAVLSKTHHTSSTLKVRAVVASVASAFFSNLDHYFRGDPWPPGGRAGGELNAYRARTARSTAASDAAEISCELSQYCCHGSLRRRASLCGTLRSVQRSGVSSRFFQSTGIDTVAVSCARGENAQTDVLVRLFLR